MQVNLPFALLGLDSYGFIDNDGILSRINPAYYLDDASCRTCFHCFLNSLEGAFDWVYYEASDGMLAFLLHCFEL